MFLPIVLVLLAGVVVAWIKLGGGKSKKNLRLPPGPRGLPLVGNLFQLSRLPHESYTKWMEDFGDIYHLKFGSDHVFVLSDPVLIRECFNNPDFQGRSDRLFNCVMSKGPNGVLLSDGQKWVEQRRFTLRHLRDFGFGKNYMETLIMEEVTEMIDHLKRDEGQRVEMNEKFTLAVINSLWMIIAGKKFRQDDAQKLSLLKEIYDTFEKMSVAQVLYFLAPSILKLAPELLGLNRAIRVADRLHAMLSEVIKEHELTMSDNGQPRDFIDAYLQEVIKTSDQHSSFYKESGHAQLLAVIGDLFFAGSSTTAATLDWTILYLATHPQCQKKIQQEIDSVVGKSRPVSLTDRPNLVYVEATIEEILRKSSIAVVGVFHTATQDSSFHGYDVPKGTLFLPNQYALHHNKKIWGDPQNFRPERFLSPDGQQRVVKSENVIPFSLGKRICIGENLARSEVFLFLTNIFQRFTVTLDPKCGGRVVNLEPKEGFILQPQDYSVLFQDRLM